MLYEFEEIDDEFADISELLSELTAADGAARARALDSLEIQLGHDDWSYDDDWCSDDERLAAMCAPVLLELAVRPHWPDRLRLLRLTAMLVGDDASAADGAILASASRAEVGRAADAVLPSLLPLLGDTDAEVRSATLELLAVCGDERNLLIPALQARYAADTESRIRLQILDVLDVVARRRPEHAAALRLPQWLTRLLHTAAAPQDRLSALSHLLALEPRALPGAVVPVVLAAARELVRGGAIEHHPDAPVRDIYLRLDSRPDEQLALVEALFALDDSDIRALACYLAERLISTWRTEYPRLLECLADQLSDPETWRPAAEALARLGTAAAPVADRILEQLERCRRITEWDDPAVLPVQLPWLTIDTATPTLSGPGPMLRAAANTGDPRALPAVRWALTLDRTPWGLDTLLAPLGAHAVELVPLIRERMRHAHAHRSDPFLDVRYYQLACALGQLGPAAAAAAADIVAVLDDRSASLVEVLGRFGVDARSTMPEVRRYLEHDRLAVRLRAAVTLWQFTGDPAPVLPQLDAALSDYEETIPASELRLRAMTAAGELGFAAAPCAPALRRLIAEDLGPRTTVAAAAALWRVTGEPEPTVTLLLGVCGRPEPDPAEWPQRGAQRHWRTVAAECFAEIGPAAGLAASLLAAELAAPRRRCDSVPADEELRRACRDALDAVRTG
ncbi:hypothetical protein [Nocardia sp. NPDC050435]|uniref:hypothetical protein n=1 Tax=Nocardia sp. NPDC050435 TaxID=3155040 RepID=UPI0033D12A4E